MLNSPLPLSSPMRRLPFLLLIIFSYTSAVAQLNNCQQPDTINVKTLNKINFQQQELFFEIKADSMVEKYTINLPCESWSIHINKLNCTIKQEAFNVHGDFMYSQAQMESGICYCNSCSKAQRIIQNDTDRYFISGKNCKGFSTTKIVKRVDKTKPEWLQKPITRGTVFNLSELNFHPNQSRFMKTSLPELVHLLNLMKVRPNIKLEIQGHVNGPDQKNSPAFQKLSENRSKAILNFLIKNGISKKRLSHRGFGNTKMLFPKPKNENEMKQNRRVEILIK